MIDDGQARISTGAGLANCTVPLSRCHGGCHTLAQGWNAPHADEQQKLNAAAPFFDVPDMESLRYLGSLAGHKGWVTAIATSSENPDMILTASRGT